MGSDILILTVYLICVIYVLYQMALSVEETLEDQIEIVLEGEALVETANAQLQPQSRVQAEANLLTQNANASLQLTFQHSDRPLGTILIQVLPQGKRPLAPALKELQVNVINQLPGQQVFLNWDHSSLTVYGGLAQRVIRQVPGRPMDLLQPQVMTVVNPGQGVTVAVTSEGLFTRPDQQTALQSAPVLLDFEKVPVLPPSKRIYSLRLLMWIQSMNREDPSAAIQLLLPFDFRIQLLPDHIALPILSWILHFFRR